MKYGGHLRLPCTQYPLRHHLAEVNQAQSQNVDAIIAGTSSANDDLKAAAEAYNIPNLHCSGGAIFWSAGSDI